jgi:hypothetical protein
MRTAAVACQRAAFEAARRAWRGAAACFRASSGAPGGVAMRLGFVLPLLLLAPPADAQDFWQHWGDGRGEVNSYRLTQPRYGHPRSGTAVLVFVTEDFSDQARVKADPGRHPASDVYPVLKLNALRHFQTGIYDYHVMTSVFARVAPGWPVAKVSFSSQEWCGQVYQQLLPRDGRIASVSHSYFDGEADRTELLPLPKDGVLEDALPILLRGWTGDYLPAGGSRTVPILGTLLRSRLEHTPLAWSEATITRGAQPAKVVVPAGTFTATAWTVAIKGGPTLTFEYEAQPPFKLLRFGSSSGEKAELLASVRSAYWKQNGPDGEAHRKELKLP